MILWCWIFWSVKMRCTVTYMSLLAIRSKTRSICWVVELLSIFKVTYWNLWKASKNAMLSEWLSSNSLTRRLILWLDLLRLWSYFSFRVGIGNYKISSLKRHLKISGANGLQLKCLILSLCCIWFNFYL